MLTRWKRKKQATKRPQRHLRPPLKVRLAIECSPKERRYIKMYAAHEDKTLNEFVLECVRDRIHKCRYPHIPNRETEDALNAAEKKEDMTYYDSIEDFFKFMDR